MGVFSRAVTWVKARLGLEPTVIGRIPRRRPVQGDRPAPPSPSPSPIHHPISPPVRSPARSPVPVVPDFRRREPDSSPATADEVCICIHDLIMRVQASSELNVPYELSVVVPRAEVTKRYVDGKLAEVSSTYSSITIARSPRPPERQRTLP